MYWKVRLFVEGGYLQQGVVTNSGEGKSLVAKITFML